MQDEKNRGSSKTIIIVTHPRWTKWCQIQSIQATFTLPPQQLFRRYCAQLQWRLRSFLIHLRRSQIS